MASDVTTEPTSSFSPPGIPTDNPSPNHRKKKALVGAAIALAVVAGSAITPLRFGIVGPFVNATVQVRVIDDANGTPIKDTAVVISGKSVTTGTDGVASVKTHPGRSTIRLDATGYGSYSRQINVGFSGLKLGDVRLHGLGFPFSVSFNDKVSGQPISGVRLSGAGTQSATTDANGNAIFHVANDGQQLSIDAEADGYAKASFSLTARSGAATAKETLVPTGVAYFLSDRSGKTSLYSTNLDGSNTQLLLAGTGHEQQVTESTSADGKFIAVTGTRLAKKDQNGSALEQLTVVNTTTGASKSVDEAEYLFVVGWIGDSVVYQTQNTYSSHVALRFAKALSLETGDITSIDNGSFTAMIVGSHVVFAQGHYSGAGYKDAAVYSYQIDHNATKIADYWPDQMQQSGVVTVALQNGDKWSEFDVTKGSLTDLNGQPNSNFVGSYVNSPDGTKTAFTKSVDGKVNIYIDTTDGPATQLTHITGVQNIRWVSDHYLVFEKSIPDETAMYAVSIDGGDPKKIVDTL